MVEGEGKTIVKIEMSREYAGMNDTIFANLTIFPDRNVSALQCNISFNGNVINAEEILKGDVFDFFASDLIRNFTIIDNQNGTINNFVAFSINSTNESGVVATIIFKAVGDGFSSINLSNLIVSDENGSVENQVVNGSIIIDSQKPEIVVDATPSIQTSGKYINLSARVDDIALKDVMLNISYPDGNYKNFSIIQNKTGNTYYCNTTYNMTGKYEFYVYARDMADNSNRSNGYHFEIKNFPPQIKNIETIPENQVVNGKVNISCRVSDDTGVKSVYLNLTYPDSSIQSFKMKNVAGTDKYFYNTSYSQAGEYHYYIWAEDIEGNANKSTDKTFTIYQPNHPPSKPSSPSPSNGSTDVPIDTTLSWTCNDPDGDTITYDVYFGTSFPLPLVSNNQSSSSYTPSTLQHGTTYYWRIVAWDEYGARNASNTWHFTTEPVYYMLSTQISPSGAGYITLNPSQGTYEEGTVVTATAHAYPGYEFSHWGGDAAGNGETIQITMDGDKTIIAYFSTVPSPPPNKKPTIVITFPSNNSILSGIVMIGGNADDVDGNIERVEIRIDSGEWIVAEGKNSWNYSWNTATVSNGHHTIYARSYDGTDYSNIASVNVVVDNVAINHPPEVIITEPKNGSIVKGSFLVKGIAIDEDGNDEIVKVEVKIDGGSWNIANGTTLWHYYIDENEISKGSHTIYARAYDGKNYSSIKYISINFQKGGRGKNLFIYLLLIIAVVVASIMLAYIFFRKKRKEGKVVEAIEEKRCFVCLGKFKPNSKIVECECGALFHKSCAERVKTCPNCGRKLV